MAKKKAIPRLEASGSQGGGSRGAISADPSRDFQPSQTEDYFRQRAERGNVAEAKRILRKAGRGRQPDPGDEL